MRMTSPSFDTLQYRHLLADLNAALPIELTIRAVRSVFPGRLDVLRQIDAQMRQAWRDGGFTDEEIAADAHVDACWDLIQLGWVERRSPFETWSHLPDGGREIERLRARIAQEFEPQVSLHDFPFAVRHRYADLVNGMDLERVLREYHRKQTPLRAQPEGNTIPVENFLWSIRRPIAVHPGALQNVALSETEHAYVGIMLRHDMTLDDVRGALREFEFHYARFRIWRHGRSRDEVANRLLEPWAAPPRPTRQDAVNQANQVLSSLNGLYCYDRLCVHHKDKPRGALSRAIEDTLALGNLPETQKGTVQKQFEATRRQISRLEKSLHLCQAAEAPST